MSRLRRPGEVPAGQSSCDIELEWLVDHGLLEVLVNGGRYASTHLSLTNRFHQPVVVRLVEGGARISDYRYHSLTDVAPN